MAASASESNGHQNGAVSKRQHYSNPDRKPDGIALPAHVYSQLPAEMRAERRWVVWNYEWVKDRWTKVPYQPNGRKASSTNPKTWVTFDAAVQAYAAGKFDGVGFVLGDGWAGVDLDDVVIATPNECNLLGYDFRLASQAADRLIARFKTYTEFSPSRTGLKLFGRGEWKTGWNRRPLPDRGEIEVYGGGRFFTVTGLASRAGIAAANDIQAALDALAEEEKPAPSPPEPDPFKLKVPSAGGSADDDSLLDRIRASRQGAKFVALYDRGDTSGHGGDESRADLALCCILAFWTRKDAGRIDRLFRGSKLYRGKWDERRKDTTYGAKTIAEAISKTVEVYDPSSAERNGKHEGGAGGFSPFTPLSPSWPEPMAAEAYHGLAGRFVRAMEPASESDPVALLVQFLLGVGNAIGRTAHAVVEGDRHHLNEYAVLVGRSAKGRKGTSWGRVKATLSRAEQRWADDRVMGGLSSGEGVIWNVRDPIEKQEKVSERGKLPKYEAVTADPGVEDKRLFVVEPEFANVLKQTERLGNTLSAILRQGWETGNLRSMTKNSPAKATDAHISIVGHITDEELRRYLTATESANGFGNRFLWFLVKRSKMLPEGGEPDGKALAGVERELARALAFGAAAGEISRDDDARALWSEIYPALSGDRHGLAGSLTGRAEAHVLRLSLVYAVLDLSPVVTVTHLAAALAVWQYAEDSVRCIFGDSTGNPLADDILALLRKSPSGMSRTEIRDMAGPRLPADRIGQALGVLLGLGLAAPEKKETGGRPVELWFARKGASRG